MTKQERDIYLGMKRAAKERDDDRSFWAVFTVGCLLFFAASLILFCIWYIAEATKVIGLLAD